jgi:EmrB/QacA subfamily drug resistance transporter
MPSTTTTDNPHHARRWLILALLGLAQLMVVLDATIVNIALPSAQHALHFSDDARQWVITAYALSFGSLLLIAGRIGDLFGRKWTFIVGLVGFAIASAIGGAAQSFGVLVGARALQGAFGALLAPAALGLLTTTFTEPGERARAYGIFGAIAGSGAAIGLLLGGVLTEYLSWRWAMYVNLAFAVPAVAGALSLLHHLPQEGRPHLDLQGAAAVSAGLFGLVFGFSNAETHGWGAPLTVGMLAGSVVALVLFVLRQQRAEHPLLPLRVVLDRDRGGSFLAMAISGAGMFGVFLFLTYYLQQTKGFSPIEAGAAFVPMCIAIIATATTATTKIVPRTGGKPLVTTGMLLGAVAMVLLTRVGVDTPYVSHVLPSLILVGIGMGLIFAPSMNTATLGVDERDAGVASAMVNTAQQVGGSVGTALLSTLSSSAVSGYVASHGGPSRGVMAEAAVLGYVTGFWVSAAFFAVGAIVVGIVLRPGVPEVGVSAEPVLAH